MKPWMLFLISFSIAILGVAAVIHWMRPYNLQTEMAAARASGLPLSIADFPRTPLPPQQNAAAEYKALGELLARKPLARDPEIDSYSIVPREKTARLRRRLTSRPDITNLVHRVVAKPGVFYQHTWTAEELFPHLAKMREAAKWIRDESVVMARDGRYAEATRNQALGFVIARHAAMEPNLLGFLVSNNCEAMALQGMSEILADAGPNASASDAVRKAIAAYTPNRNLTLCLKGEMLQGVTIARSLKTKNAEADSMFNRPNEATYIHWMTRKLLASQRPEPERLSAMKHEDAEMNRVLDRKPLSPAYTVTAILVPVASKADARGLTTDATREVISSAARILAYRARTGEYPVTLAEAVNPEPIDPITRKPLCYHRQGSGFKVWATPDTEGMDAKRVEKARALVSFQYPPIKQPVLPVVRRVHFPPRPSFPVVQHCFCKMGLKPACW